MRMTDVYSAKAIASIHTEVASNKIAYLGAGLFPAQKKAGLDLKWIRTSKGLPISLAPSSFDTNSTIRSREGFKLQETELAYFKESMLVKEQDEQDIMRVQDSADPFAQEVLDRIYNDAETLVEGADVVPERMRMQLLAPPTSGDLAGHPSISIQADDVTYAYDYDPDGTFASGNFKMLSGTSAWSDTTNSDPLQDISDACDVVEAETGARPEVMIVSKKTMNDLKKNAKLKAYVLAQNTTATVIMTDARVQSVISEELGVSVIVYTKKYKDEDGVTHSFYPDNMATLIPNGALGKTWYGITPEERTLMSRADANVSIVNTGVAVAVKITDDPVHTKTTVSEVVAPSFERMDECYVLAY